jgi:hypothetical protein
MNIEELSKSQIILLTLFVSFVTSIATGIVTVSLMEKMPLPVQQTVNRIVERTVESVVRAGQPAAVATIREKTVIVSATDQVAQAVKKISPSMVRLYTSNKEDPIFLGFGLVVDAAGTIVSDSDALGDIPDAYALATGGTSTRVFVIHRDQPTGIVTLQVSSTTSPDPLWVVATVVANTLPLGQSVVAVAGRASQRVGAGIVTAITAPDQTSGTLKVIDTSISSDMLLPGAILITTEGEVAGMSTAVSRAASPAGFMPLSALMNGATVNGSATR